MSQRPDPGTVPPAYPALPASLPAAPAAQMRSPTARAAIGRGLLVIAQAGGFWAISEAGHALAGHYGLALPGNLLGMVMLFALLAGGVVRLEWVNAGATFLLRHLAFFFIPIAVGLMTMGDVLRSHGLAILVVLGASAAAGILASGLVVQKVARGRCARPAAEEGAQ